MPNIAMPKRSMPKNVSAKSLFCQMAPISILPIIKIFSTDSEKVDVYKCAVVNQCLLKSWSYVRDAHLQTIAKYFMIIISGKCILFVYISKKI